MLVHVAIALVGLIAFSAFVVDYGVLWASRRQAQNAADAAAMAGAISMAFVDPDNQALARQAALAAAAQNLVWGEAPDVTPADVTFLPCPTGSPGAGTNACIRVDVFRNQRPGGNPLPTFFAGIAGVAEQGVRATATAEVLYGESADCVKPWAIADKWIEIRNDQAPPGWSPNDMFERYAQNGPNRGQLLSPADYYQPHGPGAMNNGNGTGFTRASTGPGGSDHGLRIVLRPGNPQPQVSPGWFRAVVLTPGERGANAYRNNIATCNPTVIGPGTVLETEPGMMNGPTRQGVQALIAQDPGASWNPGLNNGQGGIQGGCTAAGTCARSPRLVAIPAYDPDVYTAGTPHGRSDITVVKVLGFFLDRMQGNDVVGYLTAYPSLPRSTTSATPGAAFVVSVALVR